MSTPEEGDEYISMEVLITRGDGYQHSALYQRKGGVYGELVGLFKANPILYNRAYLDVLSGSKGVEVLEREYLNPFSPHVTQSRCVYDV